MPFTYVLYPSLHMCYTPRGTLATVATCPYAVYICAIPLFTYVLYPSRHPCDGGDLPICRLHMCYTPLYICAIPLAAPLRRWRPAHMPFTYVLYPSLHMCYTPRGTLATVATC